MELEQCKEAGIQNQIVVHEHCNMDPATQDMQVVRIRGSPEAAVVSVEVGKEHQRKLAYGKVVVVSYRQEDDEHTHQLLTAQGADNKGFGYEDQ